MILISLTVSFLPLNHSFQYTCNNYSVFIRTLKVSGFDEMLDRIDSNWSPNFLDINSFLTDHA
jgi:hypothetical protein